MKLRCRFGWHAWGKWEEIWAGTLNARDTQLGLPMSDWRKIADKYRYRRICEHCGVPKMKTVIVNLLDF